MAVELAGQPTEAEKSEPSLEQMTNEAFNDDIGGAAARQRPEPEVSEPAPTLVSETPTPPPPAGQVDTFSDEEKSLVNELRALKEISGTPFKTPADLVKSYKELQSQWTRDHEFVTKAKPLEHLLNEATKNPAYAQFLQQASMLWQNPQLASAYVTPQGQVDVPPDPRAYDMYDPDQYASFQKAQADYNSRQLDGRLNARLSQMEGRTRLDAEKADLKRLYPDANPDEVVERLKERSAKGWTIADGYKVLEFDNLKGKMLEEARKELNSKLEKAKVGSPSPSGAPQAQIQVSDIVEHINKYGGESARKKFGDKNYVQALQASADAQF